MINKINGNKETRIKAARTMLTGPLIGENLLAAFRDEIIKDPVLQKLFGDIGERIFVDEPPNVNESILPGLFINWKTETFTSFDTYFEGNVEAFIALPAQFNGDQSVLRAVAHMFIRYLGGPMEIFSKVSGLTHFGYGTTFTYELARFDGLTCPVIPMMIPFKFDLQRLQLLEPGFDLMAPLNQSDLDFVSSILVNITDSNTHQILDKQENEYVEEET